MLQSEFTQRTGVQVSANEFAAIHETYLQNDLTKDEFCALWRRMNAHRVKAAKENAKEQRREEMAKARLFDIVCKYEAKANFFDICDFWCFEVMTEREQSTLQKIGINTDKKRLLEAFYAIKKYLRIIKD